VKKCGLRKKKSKVQGAGVRHMVCPRDGPGGHCLRGPVPDGYWGEVAREKLRNQLKGEKKRCRSMGWGKIGVLQADWRLGGVQGVHNHRHKSKEGEESGKKVHAKEAEQTYWSVGKQGDLKGYLLVLSRNAGKDNIIQSARRGGG